MKTISSLLLMPTLLWAAPGLTIYNEDFGVVREPLALELKAGINEVSFDGATLRLEPDSVILRDSSGNPLQIFEQIYRNDPISQGFLLSLFEGQTIDFEVREANKPDRTVQGKIIRSGYGGGNQGEPIVEVDGKIRFGLPGQPVFPSLGSDTILKPRVTWKINSADTQKTDADVAYVTAGLSWEASYNVVLPEKGNEMDLVGWVTIKNQTGREFVDAHIKLMAGDVNKLQRPDQRPKGVRMMAAAAPDVSEKAFDEYHLYSLERATTLRDHQVTQVEFVRGGGLKSEVVYVYNGAMQPKVTVRREFHNTKQNGLGIPLPKGKVRFYRTDGKQLQFIGENEIDHTPADEKVRIITGEAFDLVGERKVTTSNVDSANKRAEESVEVTLRNRKQEPVTIRVVENFQRWANWTVTAKSDEFEKNNASEVEFRIDLQPGAERKLNYSVRYSW